MKMQSTAFLGAYALMRGLALMVGFYPSEVQMYSWLIKGV